MRRCALLLAALLVATLLTGSAPAAAANPVRILTLGDSMTSGDGSLLGAYRGQLDRDLAAVGVPHTISVQAVGGTTCAYWASRIEQILNATPTDVLIAWCGKNDFFAPGSWDEVHFGEAWRTIVEAGLRRGITVVAPYQQFSNPLEQQFQWGMVTHERDVNNAVWASWTLYGSNLVTMVDLTVVPGDTVHLQPDGLHPSPHGFDVIGREIFRATAARMGWPSLPSFCGMAGHAPGKPRPTYTPC